MIWESNRRFWQSSHLLPNRTQLSIDDALFSSKSTKNLLSFKDIRKNGQIETRYENNGSIFALHHIFTANVLSWRSFQLSLSGLYYATIKVVEVHAVMNKKLINLTTFMLQHVRLSYPGSTVRQQIITNSYGHPLSPQHTAMSNEYCCTACSLGKLVIRPSQSKINFESLAFLQNYEETFVDLLNQLVGRFTILWSQQMHLQNGCKFVYCPLAMQDLQGFLLQLQNYKQIFQIIQLSQFDVVMLMNLLLRLCMIIACRTFWIHAFDTRF